MYGLDLELRSRCNLIGNVFRVCRDSLKLKRDNNFIKMAKKETESFMTIIGWAVIVFALYALYKLIQSKGLI